MDLNIRQILGLVFIVTCCFAIGSFTIHCIVYQDDRTIELWVSIENLALKTKRIKFITKSV